MPILSSPHVHTPYCDGRSSAEEMVRAALARGFVSLGFSSHAKQRFDPEYSMSESAEKRYKREVRALAKRHAGRIKIWLGMERDAFSYADREGYDYVLASSHYMACEGRYFAVDSTPENLERCLRARFQGDGLALARAYYEQFAAYVEMEKPEIIGHFDLIRKLNGGNRYFDEASADYLRAATDAMERMRAVCPLMEVNTGAIARSHAAKPYPALPLLREWRRLGGEVIVSSDCHDARDIACWYDECPEYLRAAGYTRALRLGAGEALLESVPV